jgi:dUTP pyrophosphatase
MSVSNWCPSPLKFYKVKPEAFAPEWGTEHAACFDLRACLVEGVLLTEFTSRNVKSSQPVESNANGAFVFVPVGSRLLVPTGLIFDIPLGYSVRLHPRSGISFKQGLVLANQEGVIDSDYIDPTFLIIHNLTDVPVIIYHGDRIAQGEMIPDMVYEVVETPDKPQVKSDRKGGLGSTGVK